MEDLDQTLTNRFNEIKQEYESGALKEDEYDELVQDLLDLKKIDEELTTVNEKVLARKTVEVLLALYKASR